MNTFQKSLLAVGVLGLGSAVVAAPAMSQEVQAYASGSASIVLMNGASQAMGAEIAGPPGPAFQNTSVVVTPTITNSLATNTTRIDAINVNPGLATLAPSATSSVEAAVATQINTAGIANLQAGVSYTRAWQGGLQ